MTPTDIPDDVYLKAEQAAGHVTTRDDAAIVIARAILAERHRCKKIADKVAANNEGSIRDAAYAAYVVATEISRYVESGK